MQNKCFNRCRGEPTWIDLSILNWDEEHGPPTCPYCGGPVRPDVVWFGETLPHDALQAAFHASTTCDLMLVVGTSGLVHPAASLPSQAKQNSHHAAIIEINPDDTPLSPLADLRLIGPSGEILPEIIKALSNVA